MCRWVAYYGNPVRPEALLYEADNSLVEQSRRDRLAGGHPNADGLGLGWYGEREQPGLPQRGPAWGDRNLRELAGQISRGCSSPTSARRPARRWRRPTATRSATAAGCSCTTGSSTATWQLRRELLLAVDPALFPEIEGTTDSELMFYLALTFGLDDDPSAGWSAWRVRRGHGGRRVDEPLQMTVGVSDGERIYAARYASGRRQHALRSSTRGSARCTPRRDSALLRRGAGDRLRAARRPARTVGGVPPGTALTSSPATTSSGPSGSRAVAARPRRGRSRLAPPNGYRPADADRPRTGGAGAARLPEPRPRRRPGRGPLGRRRCRRAPHEVLDAAYEGGRPRLRCRPLVRPRGGVPGGVAAPRAAPGRGRSARSGATSTRPAGRSTPIRPRSSTTTPTRSAASSPRRASTWGSGLALYQIHSATPDSQACWRNARCFWSRRMPREARRSRSA